MYHKMVWEKQIELNWRRSSSMYGFNDDCSFDGTEDRRQNQQAYERRGNCPEESEDRRGDRPADWCRTPGLLYGWRVPGERPLQS